MPFDYGSAAGTFLAVMNEKINGEFGLCKFIALISAIELFMK